MTSMDDLADAGRQIDRQLEAFFAAYRCRQQHPWRWRLLSARAAIMRRLRIMSPSSGRW